MPLRSRLLTVGVAVAVLVGGATTPVLAAPAAQAGTAAPAAQVGTAAPAAQAGTAAPAAKTSAVEARRVDRVPTPKLGWYRCYQIAECATVRLPLDYDSPTGASTEIAVLRVKARQPQRKIGSLFVNPGGPGGSGTEIALNARFFLGAEVLNHFDIVGVDPRGIASSDNVKCFATTRAQTEATYGLNVFFPWGRAQEAAYIASMKKVGRACSTTGKPLTGAMSTAEVARDMDVLRRAVGDKKLSYLGFSYGSALGQYYANMFPDRVRAVAIDGILNPVSWTGTAATQNTLLDDRLRSADGSYKALREVLKRCRLAGAELCTLAGAGDPVQLFDLVARRLRAKPLVIEDPDLGTFEVTYADFVANTLFFLYDQWGYVGIDLYTNDLLVATAPASTVTAQRRAAALRSIAQRAADARREAPRRDFPYNNGLEAFAGVACTDALHPKDAALWPALTAAADRRAPYFGRAWGWSSSVCARNSWTVRDEDAYRGPFNRRTAAPVLVVGNYWDPATNYADAVSSARLLPNSRLLSSDSWGHTAYGSSACVTGAVNAYLVRLALPAAGTVCTGDVQPFVPETRRSTAADGKQLPPIAPRVPAPARPGR